MDGKACRAEPYGPLPGGGDHSPLYGPWTEPPGLRPGLTMDRAPRPVRQDVDWATPRALGLREAHRVNKVQTHYKYPP